MEQKYRKRLIADFRRLIEHKMSHALDVPGDYRYMDPESIMLLEDIVAEKFGLDVLND